MERQELRGVATAKIPVENRRIHGDQVDDHQRVEHLAERRIDVEADQPGIHFRYCRSSTGIPFRPTSARSRGR